MRALKARAELADHTPLPYESSARACSLVVLVIHADLVGVEEAVRQRLLDREAAAVDEVALADQLLRQVPAGLQGVCIWTWTGWSARTTEKRSQFKKLRLQISFFAKSQPACKEAQGQASQQGWEGRLADSPPLPDHCKLQVLPCQTVSLAALGFPQSLACT